MDVLFKISIVTLRRERSILAKTSAKGAEDAGDVSSLRRGVCEPLQVTTVRWAAPLILLLGAPVCEQKRVTMGLTENWVGLESNPEVLTEFAVKLGVDPKWAFTDVVGLDDASLRSVPQPCVGLIFLYPYSQLETHKRKLGSARGCKTPGVWFMDQTVGNACGAVALMHTVMNTLNRVSQGSGFLEGFYRDTSGASALERGQLFAPALRELNDAVAPQGQTDAPRPSADLDFHFVSFVPVGGVLYELDGNNDGPLDCGALALALTLTPTLTLAPLPPSFRRLRPFVFGH